jgi:hypothetical protein
MDCSVKTAQHIDRYRIRLDFEDGSRGDVDLAGYVRPGTVFEAFADPDYFKTFRVEYGTLVWGDGEVDLAPEKLYELATGVVIGSRQRQGAV